MKRFKKNASYPSPTPASSKPRGRAALAWQASVAGVFGLLIMQSFFNFAIGLLMGAAIFPGMLVFMLVYRRRTKVSLPGGGLLLAGLLSALALLAGLTWVHLGTAAPGEPVIFGFNAGFVGVMTALGALAARSFNRLNRNERG